MKNEIQKLISEMKLANEKAKIEIDKGRKLDIVVWAQFKAGYDAFSFVIDRLTLLLNAEAETNGEKDCKNDGNAV